MHYKILSLGFAATLAYLMGGCVSTGAYDTLPSRDQEAFQRCGPAMMSTLCGPDQDPVYQATCGRMGAANYSAQPTEHDRQVWLLGHGCPPSVLTPERYLGR